MRSNCCLKFTIAALVVMVPTLVLAVEDVSPRVQLGRIATYGYDDAGDSSSNPVYLTPKPLRVFPYVFGDFADTIGDPYFDNFPGIHALSSANQQGYIPSGLPTGKHRVVRRAERFKILERRRSGGVQCRSGGRNISAFAIREFDDHRHRASFLSWF